MRRSSAYKCSSSLFLMRVTSQTGVVVVQVRRFSKSSIRSCRVASTYMRTVQVQSVSVTESGPHQAQGTRAGRPRTASRATPAAERPGCRVWCEAVRCECDPGHRRAVPSACLPMRVSRRVGPGPGRAGGPRGGVDRSPLASRVCINSFTDLERSLPYTRHNTVWPTHAVPRDLPLTRHWTSTQHCGPRAVDHAVDPLVTSIRRLVVTARPHYRSYVTPRSPSEYLLPRSLAFRDCSCGQPAGLDGRRILPALNNGIVDRAPTAGGALFDPRH